MPASARRSIRRSPHGWSALVPVFPLADWSYYVFAMVLATFALWIAWRVSERYLDGEKRVAGLLLLTFIPFFNFHALKYNANTVLIPLWALATWCFLRSFETRNASVGGARGARRRGRHAGEILVDLPARRAWLAALADPRRGAYFRSAAPWVTIAVGAIAFAPHVVWLVGERFRAVHLCGGGAPVDAGERGALRARIPCRRRRLYRRRRP